MVKYTSLPDNKNRIYGGAYSVHDAELVAHRNSALKSFSEIDDSDPVCAEKIKQDFFNTYRTWMFKGFKFSNIDQLKHCCFTQGTTESFSHFYLRYRQGHRLRLRRAEYFYHQMMKTLWYQDHFCWLEDDEIRAGDVVLISVPFSDTGDIPDSLDQMLDQCDEKNVPVMLDLAYLNITSAEVFPYDIDFSRPCIKYVVTSLSKVFPVENLRIGLRLQREIFDDQLYVVNETNYNYINLLSAYVGTAMMQQFPADLMFNRYRHQQLLLCEHLQLTPSPCFIFGIDHHNRYPEYNRGGPSNRLCFSRVWDERSRYLTPG